MFQYIIFLTFVVTKFLLLLSWNSYCVADKSIYFILDQEILDEMSSTCIKNNLDGLTTIKMSYVKLKIDFWALSTCSGRVSKMF